LSSLVKAHLANHASIGTKLRIGRHHAIDISPYLHSRRTRRSPNNRSAEIRSSPAESRGNAVHRGGNESTHHRHAPRLQKWTHHVANFFISEIPQRTRLPVAVIRDNTIAGINVSCLDSCFL